MIGYFLIIRPVVMAGYGPRQQENGKMKAAVFLALTVVAIGIIVY